MEVYDKYTYYNKAMTALVVNNNKEDDPLKASRVQVYIPEIQGTTESVENYKEYMTASDKKSRGDFGTYPWAYNTVANVNNGDIVYVMNLSNSINTFVVIGRDASCEGSGMGGGGELDAAGLAELLIPFLIGEETGAGMYSPSNPLCQGYWDNNLAVPCQSFTTSTSASWSLGLFNWDATRAYNLLYDIACQDSNWINYFSDKSQALVENLKSDVAAGKPYSKVGLPGYRNSSDVVNTGRTAEASVVKGVKSMASSSIGQDVQKKLARKDATNYIQTLMDEGISNPAILIYMGDLVNQWGGGQPARQPYLGAMHSAAKEPSSIMSSVNDQVEAAIKTYENPNQMMKEVEALHAYWMGPLHEKEGMARYESRRNRCIAYIRELYKQGKLSQFLAGLTVIGNLMAATYKGITLAFPFESNEIVDYNFSGGAWDGTKAYTLNCKIKVPKGFGISSLFGARSFGSHKHTGVDFTAGRGTVLYAAHDGTLTIADSGSDELYSGGYGYHAIITFKNGDDTWKIYYGHMIRGSSSQYGFTVGNSYQVKTGTAIGQLDSTGSSTGDHLHYELRRNDKYVNPLPYMGLGNASYPILSSMTNFSAD